MLPNLIIIGAQKCATTSLHYYLGLHPQILMSQEKELNFFIEQRNWYNGIEWYKSHFTGEAMICGEASPSYTSYPKNKGIPERMFSIVPNAKLIYILRDPIDRVISHYIQECYITNEDRIISELLKPLDDTNNFISQSKYYMQLEQYLRYFPKPNIFIITLEDLYHYRRLTLQKTFRFLNVDNTFYSPKFNVIKYKSSIKRRKNKTGLFLQKISNKDIFKVLPTHVRVKIGEILYQPFSAKIKRPLLNENLKRDLVKYLKGDINRLRKYTGCNFDNWQV